LFLKLHQTELINPLISLCWKALYAYMKIHWKKNINTSYQSYIMMSKRAITSSTSCACLPACLTANLHLFIVYITHISTMVKKYMRGEKNQSIIFFLYSRCRHVVRLYCAHCSICNIAWRDIPMTFIAFM
jgi:hypothetical protein